MTEEKKVCETCGGEIEIFEFSQRGSVVRKPYCKQCGWIKED